MSIHSEPQSPENASSSAVGMAAPLAGHAMEMTQIGKYHTAGGHGFAAEDANHLADVLSGKRAKVVGVHHMTFHAKLQMHHAAFVSSSP